MYSGLPAGYLNALENRLIETELALFQSLCEIYGASYQALNMEAIPPRHLSKSELMEEWKRLPQKNQDESRTWWMEKRPNLAYLWVKRQGKVSDETSISMADTDSIIHSTNSPYQHEETI